MHLSFLCILVFVIFSLCRETTSRARVSRLPKMRGFLFYRTNSISQRPCKCSTIFSCSCCETVTLLYSKRQKTLCSNFTYQSNGLNVDILLNKDTIRTTIVSIYRPFELCSPIPGSLFSSICVNVLELNQFSRSLTVCVRHKIASKTQEWQIDYTCVSISTELPTATTEISTSAMSAMATSTMTTNTKATSPSGQATTVARMTSMSAGTSAGGQTSSMSTGQPSTGAPPSMAAIIGARRKRRAGIQKYYKSKIVNDKLDPSNSHSKDSMAIDRRKSPPEVSIFSTNVATSGGGTEKDGFSIVGASERKNFHNDTIYFPNRIPPLVEMIIAKNIAVNIDNADVQAGADNSVKRETDRLIFPN